MCVVTGEVGIVVGKEVGIKSGVSRSVSTRARCGGRQSDTRGMGKSDLNIQHRRGGACCRCTHSRHIADIQSTSAHTIDMY